jgi:hypothetical protein
MDAIGKKRMAKAVNILRPCRGWRMEDGGWICSTALFAILHPPSSILFDPRSHQDGTSTDIRRREYSTGPITVEYSRCCVIDIAPAAGCAGFRANRRRFSDSDDTIVFGAKAD